jgi:hypothetical protein
MFRFCPVHSSDGIATCYGLDGRIRFPEGVRDFYLLHSVQNGSEAYTATYLTGSGASLIGGKVMEA